MGSHQVLRQYHSGPFSAGAQKAHTPRSTHFVCLYIQGWIQEYGLCRGYTLEYNFIQACGNLLEIISQAYCSL